MKNGGGKCGGFESRRRVLELGFSRLEVEDDVRERGEGEMAGHWLEEKHRGHLAERLE